MILAIDCGNTNIVFAVFDEQGNIHAQKRLETSSHYTADLYAAALQKATTDSDRVNISDIKSCIIASVVPKITPHLIQFCEQILNCKPIIVGDEGVNIRLDIHVDNTQEVGADRLANAISLAKNNHIPAIILDFGTATTFDIILPAFDDSLNLAIYSGGVIAPGVHRSLEALVSTAARLSSIKIESWQADMPVIGQSTQAAMQSGILWGYVSLIDGMITRIKSTHESEMQVIATGGLAYLFAPHISQIDRIDDDLTVNGLYYIYQDNQKIE